MKIKGANPPPKPNCPPPPPVTLAEFRAGWVSLMERGQQLDSLAASLLQAATPALRAEYRQLLHDGWHEVQNLIQAARGLTAEDRATVEHSVGPLFTQDGALTDVWRRIWVDGEHLKEWTQKCRKEMVV